MNNAINFKKTTSTSTAYLVYFEDYLKPRSITKQKPLIQPHKTKRKSQLRLKLLEHPVLVATHKTKYLRLKEKTAKVFRDLHQALANFGASHCKIHRYLAFLLARNDETACKRKSGFEIYCEIASIHGFTNFVGATTLQRVFWFSMVLLAVVLSSSILWLSHFMNVHTPTLLYLESTQHSALSMPFPAVTICNLNRISKTKAENLAKRFQRKTNVSSTNELTNYFKLALYATENIMAATSEYEHFSKILKQNNYTMYQLLQEITPNCKEMLAKCVYRGQFVRCSHLFKKIQTSFGQCCSLSHEKATRKVYANKITGCGYLKGLSVLLDPHLNDYKASSFLTTGFQVLIHNELSFVDESIQQRIVATGTSNTVRIWPYETYATEHISSLNLNKRKCFLFNERKLFHFSSYSLTNCLAECRSTLFYEKCHCALPYLPKMHNWTVCGLEDRNCFLENKSLLSLTLKNPNTQLNDEQFICDCYPECNYNAYSISMDAGELSRKFALTEKRFYRGINVTNHILLRVFVGELQAELFRLDASENWLSYLGSFGGITGLFMGYSFLSGFELIFFVIVRPACNWWTKKRIQRRIKAWPQQ